MYPSSWVRVAQCSWYQQKMQTIKFDVLASTAKVMCLILKQHKLLLTYNTEESERLFVSSPRDSAALAWRITTKYSKRPSPKWAPVTIVKPLSYEQSSWYALDAGKYCCIFVSPHTLILLYLIWVMLVRCIKFNSILLSRMPANSMASTQRSLLKREETTA